MQDFNVIKSVVLEVRDDKGTLKALISRSQSQKENVFYNVSEMSQDEIKDILEVIANRVEKKVGYTKKNNDNTDEKDIH